MEEKTVKLQDACPNCAAVDNETDAIFCQSCGARLDSPLLRPPAAPRACEPGKAIAGEFVVQSLLWSAPTYNAYEAIRSSTSSRHTIIERRPGLTVQESESSQATPAGEARPRVSGSLEEAAPAFERFGLIKPIEQAIDGDQSYVVLEHIQGQALAHLDQINEFEPYGIVLDEDRHPRLIGFDRARQAGTLVEDAPIYPSRGFTAPELFLPNASDESRSDIYSIGALLLFLLSGESAG